jgi:hypothetical protein
VKPLVRKRPAEELFPGRERLKRYLPIRRESMYRPSDPQQSLFDAGGLLPPEKRERCEKSWAGAFRRHALPILRQVEDEFAELFDPTLGRPNRPVELVVGILILKEMSDLTDEEALNALEYDARWWYGFGRELHELHVCQKTLHNFREKLVEKEKSKVAFLKVTDELIRVLGVDVRRQRLDSTHILSGIAILNRLGLMCETIRVFLRELKRKDPKGYEVLGAGILKRHGEESNYQDARRKDGPRRLGVVARDVWRLVERFKGEEKITSLEEWKRVKRLFEEHCEVRPEEQEPGEDEDDHGDGGAPVVLKEAKEVGTDSLQSPHDAEATYGRKGKGYEVQVAETCTEGQEVRLITEVEVTPSCKSDIHATVKTVVTLEERGQKPEEMVADTAYCSGENAAKLAEKGVNLTAPVPNLAKPKEGKAYAEPAEKCPPQEDKAKEWLTQQEASSGFKKKYAIRAGIESTNAELKQAHGLGKLRVRGGARVKLSVYFKALACNVKRALRAWLLREKEALVACLG